MHFRLAKEFKKYFNNIMGEGGYMGGGDKKKFLQFDIYYNCALIGFAAVKTNTETSDLEDMTQTYPKEYKSSAPSIAGLLIATELKRQGVDLTSRELEKLMLKYLDNNHETHLSDAGFAMLDAYALAGAEIYRDTAMSQPMKKEDFLLEVNQILSLYK